MRIFAMFASLSCLLVSALLAQQTIFEQWKSAGRLMEEGRFAQVIEVVKPLLSSSQLNADERGKGWILLARAYQEQGDLQEARHGYEQALVELQSDPAYLHDYASALGSFSDLYRDMGDLETMAQLQNKVLHLYRQIHDSSGIAIACERLAESALLKKQLKQAQRYLECAEQDPQLATVLGSAYRVSLLNAKGWLAESKKSFQEAVLYYEQSVSLLLQKYGTLHPLSGWGYMLVGKAKAEAGDPQTGRKIMEDGLSILDQTVGKNNVRYLAARLAYSHVLSRTGDKLGAALVGAEAEKALLSIYKEQCAGCSISVVALR